MLPYHLLFLSYLLIIYLSMALCQTFVLFFCFFIVFAKWTVGIYVWLAAWFARLESWAWARASFSNLYIVGRSMLNIRIRWLLLWIRRGIKCLLLGFLTLLVMWTYREYCSYFWAWFLILLFGLIGILGAVIGAARWWILGGQQELASTVYTFDDERLWIECKRWDMWIVTSHGAVLLWMASGGRFGRSFSCGSIALALAIAVWTAALAVFICILSLLLCLIHYRVEIEWMWCVSCSLMRVEGLCLLLVRMRNRRILAFSCVG